MDKDTLKSWFSRGKKPTGEQFAAWIDSFWHKDEGLGIGDIADLPAVLGSKADAAATEEALAGKLDAGRVRFITGIEKLSLASTEQEVAAVFGLGPEINDYAARGVILLAASPGANSGCAYPVAYSWNGSWGFISYSYVTASDYLTEIGVVCYTQYPKITSIRTVRIADQNTVDTDIAGLRQELSGLAARVAALEGA